jgi:hypothetical protein
VSAPPISLTPRDAVEGRLWAATLEVAAALPSAGWTMIGAQMVILHAAAAGRDLGRTSGDLDLLVDVRIAADATRTFTVRLVELGFTPEVTIDGRSHPWS